VNENHELSLAILTNVIKFISSKNGLILNF
jgi:hypothetical protein